MLKINIDKYRFIWYNFFFIHLINQALIKKFFYLIFILFISCKSTKVTVKSNSSNLDANRVYYFNLIEATKQELFGNYKNAEQIYYQCIKENSKIPVSYYSLSKILYYKGDIQNAIKYAKIAKDLDTSNIWYLKNLASLFEMASKIDSLEATYKLICKKEEYSYECLYILSSIYLENKKYKEVLETVDIIEKKYGSTEEITKIKLSAFNYLKLYNQAIFEIKKIISIDSLNINYKIDLANYYSKTNQNIKADSIYNQYFKLNKSNEYLIISIFNHSKKTNQEKNFILQIIQDTSINESVRASVFQKMYSYNEISKIYAFFLADKLLNNSQSINTKEIISDFYIKNDSLSNSEIILKNILLVDKNNFNSWQNLLYIISKSGDNDSIYKYTTEALKYYKNSDNFNFYRGLSSYNLKNYDTAIKCLKIAEQITKNNKLLQPIYSYLGESYYYKNEYVNSDLYFNKSLQLNPNDCFVLNNYSYYLSLRNENLELAKKLSKRSLSIEPKNYIYLDTYGWILYRMNKYNKALKYIKNALQQGGINDPDINNHIGDIYFKKNNFIKAKLYWNKAIEYGYTNKEEIQQKLNETK